MKSLSQLENLVPSDKTLTMGIYLDRAPFTKKNRKKTMICLDKKADLSRSLSRL